jgi:hypothetical protein
MDSSAHFLFWQVAAKGKVDFHLFLLVRMAGLVKAAVPPRFPRCACE